jgi:hypothetical protein
VFPGIAERAAAAIEVRLAADEYDGMDEAALADCSPAIRTIFARTKHLRMRTMPPGPPRQSHAGRRVSSPRPESGSGRLA